jgi:secreted trypsin-like serine protease
MVFRIRYFTLLVSSFASFACAMDGTADIYTSSDPVSDAASDVGNVAERGSDIIGSSSTSISLVPWTAFVEVGGLGGFDCAGAILDKRWILTAGNCAGFYTPAELRVVVGMSKRSELNQAQIKNVAEIHVAPGYENFGDGLKYNNLALLKVSSDIDLSTPNAKAIRYATMNDGPYFAANRVGTVSGWGATSYGGALPDAIRRQTIPVVPNPIAGPLLQPFIGAISFKMLMAGRLGSESGHHTTGDNGDPLVFDSPRGPIVAGIATGGSGCGADCPSIYARVAVFSDWIAEKLGHGRNLKWRVDTNRDGVVDIEKTFGRITDWPVPGDYNDDNVDDFAVLRESGTQWKWLIDTNRDGAADIDLNYGESTDFPMVGDYNGDGATDLAVVRAKSALLGWQWIVDTNLNGVTNIRVDYGDFVEVPVPADFNADGRTDLGLAADDGSHWFWRWDTNLDAATNDGALYGRDTDGLISGNFGGDANADLGLLRVLSTKELQWIIDTNQNEETDIRINFGNVSSNAVPADYNGDGLLDFAYVNGTRAPITSADISAGKVWKLDTNRDGAADYEVPFGAFTDLALPGDYDGNLSADLVVVSAVP